MHLAGKMLAGFLRLSCLGRFLHFGRFRATGNPGADPQAEHRQCGSDAQRAPAPPVHGKLVILTNDLPAVPAD